MNYEAPTPPRRDEVENRILSYFSSCPFCKSQTMEFTWGDLVPNGMTCQNCGATWEPDMSYNVEWVFTSATLVKLGKERKGSSLLNRMYSADFWKELASPNPAANDQERTKSEQSPGAPNRVVIIREVVKIRCRYCGGLFDEVQDRCPYCGGRR